MRVKSLFNARIFSSHTDGKNLHLTCPSENHEEKRLCFYPPPPVSPSPSSFSTSPHRATLRRCAGTDGVNLPLRCSPIGGAAVMLRPLPRRCPTDGGAGAPSGGWCRISGAAQVARSGAAAAARFAHVTTAHRDGGNGGSPFSPDTKLLLRSCR